MEITSRHWLIALLIAGLFHAALAYALVQATVPVREQAAGVTLELGLGGAPGLTGAKGNNGALESTASTDAPLTAAPAPMTAVDQTPLDQSQIAIENPPALQPAAANETVVVAKAVSEPRPTVPSRVTKKQSKTAPKNPARQTAPSPAATVKAPPKKPAARPASAPNPAPKVAAPSSSKRLPRKHSEPDRAAGQGSKAGALGSGDDGRPGAGSDAGSGAGGQGGGKGSSGNKAAAKNYYGRLATWLARHKRYPNQARRLHQEGTVKVTFTVTSNGRVVSKRITKSSGHALLDREVQDMLERASPLPRIPSALNRSSITITLPVAFNLR